MQKHTRASFPIVRTLLKTAIGTLLIFISYMIVKTDGLPAAVALSVVALVIWNTSGSRSPSLRWCSLFLIDCLVCGLGLILGIAGYRLWQHLDNPLALAVSLFTVWLWMELAKDEGFGPWPREPVVLAERTETPFTSHVDRHFDAGHYAYPAAASVVSTYDDGAVDDFDPIFTSHSDSDEYTCSSITINPASGLPMVFGGMSGFDVAGNTYGSDDSSSDSLFSDDPWMSGDDGHASFHDDSLHTNASDD